MSKLVHSRVARRKAKRKKQLLILLSTALLIMVAVTSYGLHLYSKADSVLSDAYEDDGRDKSDLRDTIVDPKFDNVSILFMGVDSSEKRENEDSARTDALMLATLNKDEKSVKLLSIPRDSLVYVPQVGYETKINHAHAYGGHRATIETVENILEIPIDYYMTVNFEAFIDVVDSLDGITIDVPYEFKEMNSKDKKNAIHLKEGEQKLDGEEALALARTRKLDNDIERGKRQQDIIKAIVKRAASIDSVLKYDDMIEAVGGNLKTNMLFSEIKSFVSYGTSGSKLKIETLTLDGQDYQPNDTYYWQIDELALEDTKEILREHLELDDSDVPSDLTANEEN